MRLGQLVIIGQTFGKLGHVLELTGHCKRRGIYQIERQGVRLGSTCRSDGIFLNQLVDGHDLQFRLVFSLGVEGLHELWHEFRSV